MFVFSDPALDKQSKVDGWIVWKAINNKTCNSPEQWSLMNVLNAEGSVSDNELEIALKWLCCETYLAPNQFHSYSGHSLKNKHKKTQNTINKMNGDMRENTLFSG